MQGPESTDQNQGGTKPKPVQVKDPKKDPDPDPFTYWGPK